MNYGDVIAKIKELENGDEMVATLLLKTQKQNAENESLRKKKKAAEEKAEKTTEKIEQYNKIMTALDAHGVSLDDDATGKIKKAFKATEKVSDYDKMVAKVSKLQTSIDEMVAANTQLKAKNKKATIKTALMDSFNKNILNPAVTLDYRIQNGIFDLNDDGKVVYKTKTGEDVVDDVFKAYATDYVNEVKAERKGAGTTPGGGPNTLNMSYEEACNMNGEKFNSLSDEQQAEVLRIAQKD